MDQLVSTISSPVALSVCAARLGAGAQLEGVVRSRLASNGDTHTCMYGPCPHAVFRSWLSKAERQRVPPRSSKLWAVPCR